MTFGDPKRGEFRAFEPDLGSEAAKNQEIGQFRSRGSGSEGFRSMSTQLSTLSSPRSQELKSSTVKNDGCRRSWTSRTTSGGSSDAFGRSRSCDRLVREQTTCCIKDLNALRMEVAAKSHVSACKR